MKNNKKLQAGLSDISTSFSPVSIYLMIRSLREKRNVLPAFRTSEKNRKKGIKKMARSHSVKIQQYTIDGKYKTTYPSIKNATKVTGVNGSHIIACAKGQRKRGGGYVWKYETDDYNLMD